MLITDLEGRRCKFAASDVLLIAQRMIEIDGCASPEVDPATCDVTIAIGERVITITAADNFVSVAEQYDEEVASRYGL